MSPDLSRREFMETSAAMAAVSALPGTAISTAANAEAGKTGIENRQPISFRLNGRPVDVSAEPRVSLLDLLRDRLHLTGTKKGCNEGACGVCTVLVDGLRMNACLMLAVQAEGREVTTIEGIAGPDGLLHPVQQAFIEHDAFQCGYCTPGQILSAISCIKEGHATDEASVREWMSGNICRCAAYPQITAAVLDAATRMERG
jgi:xanthine dehydrogenase YagT iron-sulfur-binding subunit